MPTYTFEATDMQKAVVAEQGVAKTCGESNAKRPV